MPRGGFHMVSTFLFTFGLSLLMLYGNFQYLPPRACPQPLHFFLQFLGAVFVIEVFQHALWYTLEKNILYKLPTWSFSLDDQCDRWQNYYTCEKAEVFEILQLYPTTETITVVMAMLFLLCSMHITSLADIRLIRKGPKIFLTNMFRSIKVKFCEKRSSHATTARRTKHVRFQNTPRCYSNVQDNRLSLQDQLVRARPVLQVVVQDQLEVAPQHNSGLLVHQYNNIPHAHIYEPTLAGQRLVQVVEQIVAEPHQETLSSTSRKEPNLFLLQPVERRVDSNLSLVRPVGPSLSLVRPNEPRGNPSVSLVQPTDHRVETNPSLLRPVEPRINPSLSLVRQAESRVEKNLSLLRPVEPRTDTEPSPVWPPKRRVDTNLSLVRPVVSRIDPSLSLGRSVEPRISPNPSLLRPVEHHLPPIQPVNNRMAPNYGIPRSFEPRVEPNLFLVRPVGQRVEPNQSGEPMEQNKIVCKYKKARKRKYECERTPKLLRSGNCYP